MWQMLCSVFFPLFQLNSNRTSRSNLLLQWTPAHLSFDGSLVCRCFVSGVAASDFCFLLFFSYLSDSDRFRKKQKANKCLGRKKKQKFMFAVMPICGCIRGFRFNPRALVKWSRFGVGGLCQGTRLSISLLPFFLLISSLLLRSVLLLLPPWAPFIPSSW